MRVSKRSFLLPAEIAGSLLSFVLPRTPVDPSFQTALERRTLGRTGLRVSILGFGAAPIGFSPHRDHDAFSALLRFAVDSGVNFFDTAPDYREIEEILGSALEGQAVILATKAGRRQEPDGRGGWQVWEDWSAAGVTEAIERSVRRLRRDCLDLVQLHSPPLHVLEAGEALGAVERARDAGKVLWIGASADDREAEWVIQSGRFDTLQISYSVLQQEPGDSLLDRAVDAGLGLIIKQPVANGIADLASRPEHPDWSWKWETAQHMDLSALGPPGERTAGALRWVLADPRICTAIVGTAKREHLEQNLAAAAQPVNHPTFEALQQAWRKARARLTP